MGGGSPGFSLSRAVGPRGADEAPTRDLFGSQTTEDALKDVGWT